MTNFEELKSKKRSTFSIPSQSSSSIENNRETSRTNTIALSGNDKLWNAQLRLYDKIIEMVATSMEKLNKQEARLKSQEELQEEISKNIQLSQKDLEKQIARITEHEKRFKIQERSLAEQSKGNLELFGIFASIFTFISVEIKILESAQGIYQLLGLTLILIAGILLMISLIFLSSKVLLLKESLNKTKKRLFLWIFIFSAICLLGGIFFSSLGNNNLTINFGNSNKEQINELKQQVQELKSIITQ
jgi:uncharacterized protein YggU (UPF0235/DUF167 family)